MSSSKYCFLNSILISQEAGRVAWYSHLLKNFPQFAVIHTVKSFSVVNEAEVDVFWNSVASSCIRVSQETSKVVSYSHLFKNFPQFIVIHTVKGFSVVNETDIDVFVGNESDSHSVVSNS